MDCPNSGSQNIQLRHVGKKTGGVIGATAGGLAGEKLDGSVFDEYDCTHCEHTFNEP